MSSYLSKEAAIDARIRRENQLNENEIDIPSEANPGNQKRGEKEIKGESKRITPEYVLSLSNVTEGYLCDPEANIYGIDFTRFRVRDTETDVTLFEVKKSQSPSDGSNPTPSRFVKYLFPPALLDLKTLGATIEFKIGKEIPVNEFHMIERHFFKGRCLKTFEFNFGFCMPLSVNTCEHIYDMPQLTAKEKDELISCPYETKSDSFYFVNGELVMHHKAEYAYNAQTNTT